MPQDLVVGRRDRRRGAKRSALGLALGALIAACSATPTEPPPPPPPAAQSILVVAGDAQTAPAGAATAAAPEVRLTNAAGSGVAGLAVQFQVQSGGGSVQNAAATTDADGRASAGTWTLGRTAGPQELRATVAGVGSLIFHATATPLAPTSLSVLRGNGQSGLAGSAVGVRPAVTVADEHGNPVSDVSVTFSVRSGGGSIQGAIQVSGENGVAEVGEWTLGTSGGLNELQATFAGATAVVFDATAIGAGSATLTISQGDAQSARVGSSVPIRPAVRLVDGQGNGIAGITVAFTVEAGGGSLTNGVQTTDADGDASVGGWTLGTQAGPNELQAFVGGLSAIRFSAQATPGPAATMTIFEGDAQSAAIGTNVAIAPSVLIVDGFANPVAAVPVTFAVTGGGGSVAGGTQTSDAAGRATVGSWTVGGTQGANTLTATAAGAGIAGNPATFSAMATTVPASVTATAGQGQSATVASQVSTAPEVRVLDAASNPVEGVSVTFAITGGGGTISGAVQGTDADGRASVASWTLGNAPGSNTVSATVTGSGISGNPVTFSATAQTGPAATVVATQGGGQTAGVGTAVSIPPQVRVTDAQGNDLQGVPVTFAVASGGGSVSGSSQTTGSGGQATVGAWTLGASPGTNTITATVAGSGIGGNPVTFSATGASIPAAVVASAGTNQSATVGTQVGTAPEVRVTDAIGNPVQGVTVSFAVTGGGGSLSGGTTPTTDADGRAAVGGWTLGSVPGSNTLSATVTGSSIAGNPVGFSATGLVGPPATVVATQGNGQSASVGGTVSVDPQVRVQDASGNNVPGVSVTFAVTSGGGSVSGSTQTTGSNGRATVGSWTLGSSPGTNTLSATVAGGGIGGNPVTFSATGTAGGGGSYDIEIRYNPGSTPTGPQSTAFNQARSTWEAIITNDLLDTPVNRPAGSCSSPNAINETVDDLVIFVTLEPIDGAGGTLGSAGPCLIRSGSGLTLVGQMRFDTADLAGLQSSGLLDEVIVHEMGHVLGIGTLWNTHSFLTGGGGPDPFFTGPLAIAAFNSVGGGSYVGPKVPVENTGGSGTADGHWRESVFHNELMTGFVNPGSNPLSLVTIQSMADMGYPVDTGQADSYSLPPSTNVVPNPNAGGTLGFALHGDIWRVPIGVVAADGRFVGLIRR